MMSASSPPRRVSFPGPPTMQAGIVPVLTEIASLPAEPWTTIFLTDVTAKVCTRPLMPARSFLLSILTWITSSPMPPVTVSTPLTSWMGDGGMEAVTVMLNA